MLSSTNGNFSECCQSPSIIQNFLVHSSYRFIRNHCEPIEFNLESHSQLKSETSSNFNGKCQINYWTKEKRKSLEQNTDCPKTFQTNYSSEKVYTFETHKCSSILHSHERSKLSLPLSLSNKIIIATALQFQTFPLHPISIQLFRPPASKLFSTACWLSPSLFCVLSHSWNLNSRPSQWKQTSPTASAASLSFHTFTAKKIGESITMDKRKKRDEDERDCQDERMRGAHTQHEKDMNNWMWNVLV